MIFFLSQVECFTVIYGDLSTVVLDNVEVGVDEGNVECVSTQNNRSCYSASLGGGKWALVLNFFKATQLATDGEGLESEAFQLG